MYKHILIATDGSELATRGLKHGLELAKTLGAEVTIVTVTETWSALELAHEAEHGASYPILEFEKAAMALASRVLSTSLQTAKEQGVTAGTLHVPDQHPADGIIKAATDTGSDLIVMASHGRRGLGRLLLGSQALQVLTHSNIPTLIVR